MRKTESKAKNIGIIGLGVSGKKLVQLVFEIFPEAKKIAFEKKDEREFLNEKENSEFLKKYRDLKVVFNYAEEDIKKSGVDFVILSSGIKHDIFEKEKIPFVSELDFAFSLLPPKSKVILITGTKGKGTTLSILSRMLKERGIEHYAGGNIGEIEGEIRTLSDAVILSKERHYEVFVFEVSSFQLRSSFKTNPYTLALTSFGKDHLDFHTSLFDYFNSKVKLSKRANYLVFPSSSLFKYFMFPESFEILKREGDNFEKIEEIKAEDFEGFFGGDITVGNKSNFLCALSILYTIIFGEKEKREGKVKGKGKEKEEREGEKMQVERYMSEKKYSEKKHEVIEFGKRFLKNIGIPKRKYCFNVMEVKVRRTSNFHEKDEKIFIRIINDAKSTNPLSLANALLSLKEGEKCVLIAGGRTKGFDFSEIEEIIKNKVEHAFLIGQHKAELSKHFDGKFTLCQGLEEAVDKSLEFIMRKNQNGRGEVSTLLFSPGAASQPDFTRAEERGQKFDEIIRSKLKLLGISKN